MSESEHGHRQRIAVQFPHANLNVVCVVFASIPLQSSQYVAS